MTIQMSIDVRDNMLDAFESTTGVSAVLLIRSGAPPANCAAANSGTVLATLALPVDWMNAASGGSKTKLGTWAEASADNAGTAGHFRIYDSTATTCHMQGTITSVLVGTGDMLLDNAVLAAGQAFSVSTFTLTAPGA